MMSRFHIAPIFTFLTFCASLGAAEFQNGSFEDGLTGWRQYWFRGAAGASIGVDKNRYREGSKSLSLDIPAEKSRFRLSQTVAVEPDATYRMSLWFYTKATGGDGGGTLRLGPSDAEGRHLGYFGRRTLHPTGNVWVEHEVFFHAPAEAKSVMIEFNFHGPLDGWLDAVSWEKVEPAASSELKLLFGEETPVFEELLVPGTEPKTPRMFPYWSYSGDTSHYGDMALRYGHAYDIAAGIRGMCHAPIGSAVSNVARAAHGTCRKMGSAGDVLSALSARHDQASTPCRGRPLSR